MQADFKTQVLADLDLQEHTQDDGEFTITYMLLFNAETREQAISPVLKVFTDTVETGYVEALPREILRLFVEDADQNGYTFPVWSQRQLLDFVNEFDPQQVDIPEGVAGFTLAIEYSHKDDDDICKISTELLFSRVRTEYMTAEEAVEYDNVAGNYVTGTDEYIAVAATMYSEEREDIY